MGRLIYTIMMLFLIFLCIACEDPYQEVKSAKGTVFTGTIVEFTTELGRECVFVKNGYGGGLSCKFE